MVDEKYDKFESLPIPTYEEATSSRPASSQNHRGAQEISDDAERQGLLERGGGGNTHHARNGSYHAPTVESGRSSIDSDLSLPEVDGDEAEAVELRHDMEQMELDDPAYARSGLRSSLSKRFITFSHTLSSLHLPSFRVSFPSLGWATDHIPSIPERYRIGFPVLARLFGLFVIGLLVYALFALDVLPNRARLATHYDPEAVRSRAQGEADSNRIREYLRYITSFDHVAGTEGDLYLAKWQLENWEASGVDNAVIMDYFVYLNYPNKDGRRVAIIDPPEQRFVAQLEEDNVFQEDGSIQQQTLNWHGNSRNGNVTGHLVYANGGSREDFQKLADMGVEVNGSIALVRYYHTQGDRALKIKAAELAGAVGCLIYSDPKEDGFLKGEPLPNGPWRPSDSVQRGGVSLMSWVTGDPLTPGWPSTHDSDRLSEFNNSGLVNIPSLPLAWRDALPLLKSLQGHGKQLDGSKDDGWIGGVPGVTEWWTGDTSSPTVHLQNLNDENKRQQIWNVHSIIQGVETPDKRVVVGNHRDSWCFGSVDPGSGTAVLMEVVKIFGALRALGWRPLRTIEFVSWDAEEYNLIGSTEYVEDNIEFIREHGVAYLNVDVGVYGDKFRAAASPLFEKALLHVLDRVGDPVKNKTLRQLWDDDNAGLEGLGAGSDYVAFQDLAGTSSLDFGFEGPRYGYPYHSCHETFEWMEKFGDPGFQYHKMLAQVWALMILEIADRPIIPYDLTAYAKAINTYVDNLDADIRDAPGDDSAKAVMNVSPLRDAASLFFDNAANFQLFEDYWSSQVLGRGGFENNAFALKRIEHNERLIRFETDLLDLPGMFSGDEKEEHGIPGRNQYKHIIFGPQAWSGYDEAFLPAIRDALDEGRWADAQKQLEKAARILQRAATRLLEVD